MSHSQNLFHIRQRKRRLKRRNFGISLGLSCGLIICFAIFVSSITIAWAYSNITEGLPSPNELHTLLDPSPGSLFEPTKIFDRSGTFLLAELENPAVGNNKYLTLNAQLASQKNNEIDFQTIPPVLMLSTIAASDPGFWNHTGYSLKGIFTHEHPTIAQRLVNDFLLWQEPTGFRKALRERLLAAQITSLYGRDKILEWFINYADYGNYAFGAADASKVYFNKDAGNLTLFEASILAATAETPLLNPWDASTVSSEKGKQLIQTMLSKGWISTEQANQNNIRTFSFDKPQITANNIAPDLIDYALSQLDSKSNLDRVKRGGFIIITTIDYHLQAQVDCTLVTQINQLRGENGSPTAFDGEECESARLLPTLVVEKIDKARSIDVGLIVLDSSKGEILAMTSTGNQHSPSWFPGAYSMNNAWKEHATGTILTPLVYLSALTRGFTLASLVWDIPSQEPLVIPNPNDTHQGPMRLRIALANDYLAPALTIMNQIGIENVKSISKQFGIPIESIQNNDTATDTLDNTEASLIEISQFYAALANQGNQLGWVDNTSLRNQNDTSIKPVAILSVEDVHGNLWLENEHEIQKKTVTSPQLAYLLNIALSDKTSTWKTLGHPNVLEVGFQAAAKQGKSFSDDSSAWTMGYTPELVVGVWTGEEKQSKSVSSPNISSSLWRAVIQYASKKYPPSNWVKPPGINSILVCDPSGMLPSTNCPASVEEVFMAGTEPTAVDTLYRSLEINKETGLLATVFTPAEYIENKVFIDFPPEALSWATSSGFDVPPSSYDLISPQTNKNSNAQISHPKMFSYVHGSVDIKGTAQGEGFQYYRLQVGKGVNPTRWLQIGDDISNPVTDGRLIQWDTTGLDGLYAIQLTIIYDENLIKNSFTQVTIDNLTPQISFIYPQDGQSISLNGSKKMTIQLEVSDNLGIDQVEMMVDKESIATLYQSPFAYSWKVSTGEHVLSVKAIDLAGNVSESSIIFNVFP